MLVQLDAVSFGYDGTAPGSGVLAGVDLAIAPGEIVGVLGPNGSGKSTLINLIAGLIRPGTGAVMTATGGAIIPIVAQDYRSGLLPWLSAGDNICLPLVLAGVPKKEHANRLKMLLDSTGMSFDVGLPPYRLSGGQAQLVMLLRALILDAPLVLLDEPYSALDIFTSLTLAEMTADLLRKRGAGALFVSHDIDEALLVSDRVAVLTRRPGRFSGAMEVRLPLPRDRRQLEGHEFVALRSELLQLIRTSEKPS